MEFRWAVIACLGVLVFGTLKGIVAAIFVTIHLVYRLTTDLAQRHRDAEKNFFGTSQRLCASARKIQQNRHYHCKCWIFTHILT